MCPVSWWCRRVAFCAAVSFIASLCVSARCAAAENDSPALPPAVQTQLDEAATRLSALIRRPGVSPPSPKLLVVDFPARNAAHVSRLGMLLADRFSESLSRIASGFTVLDRKPLPEFLRQNWMTPDAEIDADVCLWLARQLGASGAIRGTLVPAPGRTLWITFAVEGLGPVYRSEAELPVTDPLEELLKENVPATLPGPDPIPPEQDVLAAGTNGVTAPACEYCPDPDYTPIALGLRFQGSVILSVVVGRDGKASAIKVVKGAPLGLTKQAVDALAKWRLKPALKDGQPVPVRLNVELVFRPLA